MRRVWLAALVGTVFAACGDEGDGASTQRTESPSLAPTATPTPTPSAEATPPTATAPSAPSPPPDATGPEEQPGGAGDEEPVRTPVRVVLDAEGITPPRVEVPAFLGLRITVRNDLPRRVTVTLRGGHRAVAVRPGSRRGFDVGGLRPGEYPLDAGSAGRGLVVAR